MINPLVIEATEGLDTPVKLEQTSKYKYKVIYGLDISEGLCYNQAVIEFSYCVGHSRECLGESVYYDLYLY